MKIVTILLVLIPQTLGNIFLINLNNNFIVDKKEEHKEQIVTLTTYTATSSETDSTPNITASGFKIDTSNPSKHKIIAISRDLKRKGWAFNKKVRIRRAGKYNGVYVIKDLMNKRHKKRIDILVSNDKRPIKLRNVEVTLLK
jgi:3D (Asp-Asp-Asp) domain-containing protein